MGGFADWGDGARFWRRPKKVNLGRKWLQTEDEGKFSCEKLRVVLGVPLVVAVRQNAHLEMNMRTQMLKSGFGDLQNIFRPFLR